MGDSGCVAVVGAGPYGLSVAAHLRAAGVPCRVFGRPMALWRDHMPHGMFLKSPGFASSLSSPDGGHRLADFCAQAGRPYAASGPPVALADFAAYGLWFAGRLVPDVEQAMVTGVAAAGDGYQLTLDTGDELRAAHVVVAAGVQHFAVLPEQLAVLPPALCTHSSAHPDLGAFAGRRVVVVGAGQSAVESAALLHEGGAEVTLAARAGRIVWNWPWPELDGPRTSLRSPLEGLGPGWRLWAYKRHPELFRYLPRDTRVRLARTVLGPAAADWLADRVDGKVSVLLGRRLTWAKADGDGVRLGLEDAGGGHAELTADHVIAATGYRPDLARLTFIDPELRAVLRTLAGTPVVDRGFGSPAAGLYFTGPCVAPTFGPVMRFVCGSDYAARVITARLSRRG